MIIKNDKDIVKTYICDSANMKGNADTVYIPENVNELRNILIECNKTKTPVTISGAGTGLTGGKTPQSGVIISTERLNKILYVDTNNKTITIQPGVIFSEMDKVLEENNLFYPPNPTEINSTIGGNVSTNASGARTFKYGATREFINRLKIILVNGDTLDIERGSSFEKSGILNYTSESCNNYKVKIDNINMPGIKHAAGYYMKKGMDAIDLLIGSEGTLGVISEIELKLLNRKNDVLGGLIFFKNTEKMLQFIEILRTYSIERNKKDIIDNDKITARLIEYFDLNSLKVLKPQFNEIPDSAIGAIWFEQEYNPEFEESLITQWYDFISEHTDLADETWFATDEKMHAKLRDFRHQLPLNVYEKLTSNSYRKVGTDTAVPDKYFNELFNFIKDKLDVSELSHVIFGHVGNSHLHANIFVQDETEFIEAMKIYDDIIDFSLERNGTVSAEHGIGKLKKKYLLRMFGEKNIEKMKIIKNKFDPYDILGRGNLFD